MEFERRSALLLGSWIAVNLAITINVGMYQSTALAILMTGTALACAAAVLLQRDGPFPTLDPSLVAAAAGVSLAVSIFFSAHLYRLDRAYGISRDLGVLAAGLALAVVVAPVIYRRVLALCAVAISAGGLVAVLIYDQEPQIDVWYILTEGSRRMASGHNIFTSCWPGNTDPLTECVYPYLPMTSVVQTPFRWVFGDVRYSYIAALVLGSAMLWRLGGRTWGPALASLVLVGPSLRYVVEFAWTESLLFAGIAGMVLAVMRGRMMLAMVAFGFALATKQHILLLLPLAAWWPAFGLRRTAISLAGAAMVTLPWFMLDPTAFLDDALQFNLHLEPRLDSLSLFTAALNAGWKPPFFLVGALTIAAIIAVLYFVPRTATGFALGSTLVLFTFSLLNKQSFFNQWWLVGALALLTVATAIAESSERATTDEVTA